MKILMVSSYLPYPLTSGGHIRLYNLIKNLSLENDITLVCEKRNYQTQDDVKEIEKICKKVITVARREQWSIKNILKTGFSKDPFLLVGHKSSEMKNLIRDELVKERFDVLHVETFYVMQNLPKSYLPLVLVEHNIEYLVYKKYADLANPILRPLLYIDVWKIKKKEEEAWKKADKLVAVSALEKALMRREDASIVPNGVDTKLFKFREFEKAPSEKRVLFIGDFKWLQNRDALEFILSEIWPKIRAKISSVNAKIDLKLWIVGKDMPQSFKKYEARDIIFDQNNKDTAWNIFRRAYILLAPIRAGGGTSYKVLEAMSTGIGIVTTKLGIEGLEAKNGVNVLSAEDAETLANATLELLTDGSLYRKLTHNSRKFVEDNYDWQNISRRLSSVYISAK